MNAPGYVISRRGAVKFLARTRRFVHAIDKEMHRYRANGLDLHGLSRPIVTRADDGLSIIEETRVQEWPQDGLCYPDANGLYWCLHRSFSKAGDSIHKRLAFRAIVKSAAGDFI